MVGLMLAPQLNAELRGALEASSVCYGVHDDVGAAHLQAGVLAPAFILQQRDPRPVLKRYLPLSRRGVAEKDGAGVVGGRAGAEVHHLDKFEEQIPSRFPGSSPWVNRNPL